MGLAAIKTSIKDLYNNNTLKKKIKIGVVKGQVIPEKISQLIKNSDSKTTDSKDDLTNLKRLTLKRSDAVLIDENILYYFKAIDPELATAIDMIPDTLAPSPVYACFSKNAAAQLEQFNQFLLTIDTDFIVYDLF